MRLFRLAMSVLVLIAGADFGHGSPIDVPTLTDADDIVRFDLLGGLATPSPGVFGQGSLLWTSRPQDAFGLAFGVAKHEMVTENAKFSAEHVDGVWEHTWPLLGGYHALRLRGGIGLARAHRAMDKNVATSMGDDPSRIYWGAHASASLALDVPVADLIWVRAGCQTQKVFLERTPTQLALVGGLSWGGQWFGMGD